MEYVFLFSVVAPLALLVLNLTGFRAGNSPAVAMAFEAPAPVLPATPAPAPAPVAEPVVAAAPTAEARTVSTSFASVIARNKRHRRDFFGDYTPVTADTAVADEPNVDAEIYLMPRRDDAAPAALPTAPLMAHARPGGNLVSLPTRTPLADQRSVAQR